MNKIKKTLASLLIGASSFLGTGCSNLGLEGRVINDGIKINIDWNNINRGVVDLSTPENISQYLFACLNYRTEPVEKWQSAKETIDKGYGDCDDFAILGAYHAEKLSYSPKVLLLWCSNRNIGHALTLLEKKTEKGKKYGYISRSGSVNPEYESIEKLMEKINESTSEDFKALKEYNALPWYEILRGPYKFDKFFVLDLNVKTKKQPKGVDWRTGKDNMYSYYEPIIKEGIKR